MRRTSLCVAAILGSAFAASPVLAGQSSPTVIVIEPPSIPVVLGSGYDSMRGNWMPVTQCFSYINRTATVGASGPASSAGTTWSLAMDQENVASAMNLSAAASVQISFGGSLSASDKGGFATKSKTSHSSLTIIGAWSQVNPMQILMPSSDPKGILINVARYANAAAFRAECGDFVVVGVQTGREIYGTFSVTNDSTSSNNKLNNDAAVSYSSLMGSATASFDYAAASSDSSLQSALAAQIWTNDVTPPVPTNMKEFQKEMSDYSSGAKYKPSSPAVVMLMLQPYSTIATNWPTAWVENPLAPSPDDKLEWLASAAFTIQGLITDSQHVIDHGHPHIPDVLGYNATGGNLYALGLTDGKRRKNLDYIKSRNAFYRSELTDLQKAFGENKCALAGAFSASGQPQTICDRLANHWQNFDAVASAEYANFPQRYASSCYTSGNGSAGVSLPGTKAQAVNAASLEGAFFGGAPVKLDHFHGDTNMAGNPVQLRAAITLLANNAHGRLDEATNLLGKLNLVTTEVGGDGTAFQTTVTKPVFYLNGQNGQAPSPASQALGTYGECVFASPSGIRNPVVPVSLGASVGQRDAQGALFQNTGSNPRGVVKFTGVGQGQRAGILGDVSCTVYGGSGDDSSVESCTAATFLDVQLDLKDKLDVIAEDADWKAPTWPKIPTAATTVPAPTPPWTGKAWVSHRNMRRQLAAVTCKPGSETIQTLYGPLCAISPVRHVSK